MSKGSGTSHHRLRSLTGLVTIILLPFFLIGFVLAISGRADGFLNWITGPFGALSTIIFLTSALWYCKLEFDEVILDYTDGGMRSFGLMANRIVAFLAWAIALFVIVTMWLGLGA